MESCGAGMAKEYAGDSAASIQTANKKEKIRGEVMWRAGLSTASLCLFMQMLGHLALIDSIFTECKLHFVMYNLYTVLRFVKYFF